MVGGFRGPIAATHGKTDALVRVTMLLLCMPVYIGQPTFQPASSAVLSRKLFRENSTVGITIVFEHPCFAMI